MNSAPNLPKKRVTRDLLDLWSRVWNTGSVREPEVKLCVSGAETSLKTDAGVLSTEDRLHPWFVGVGMGLGWPGASAVLVSALTLLWLPSAKGLNFFYLKIHIALHLPF